MVAEQLATEMTQRFVDLVARTREHGLGIPFVSELLARLRPDH